MESGGVFQPVAKIHSSGTMDTSAYKITTKAATRFEPTDGSTTE